MEKEIRESLDELVYWVEYLFKCDGYKMSDGDNWIGPILHNAYIRAKYAPYHNEIEKYSEEEA